MIDWLKKIGSETGKHTQQDNGNLVELHCKGKYSFVVEENEESLEEFKERYLRLYNNFGYLKPIYTPKYYSHYVHIDYYIEVFYNEKKYSISNEILIYEATNEFDAYNHIHKILQGSEKEMKNMNDALGRDIERELRKKLKEATINDIKEIVRKGKEFAIDFTITTSKSDLE